MLTIVSDFGSRLNDPLFLFGLIALVIIIIIAILITQQKRGPKETTLFIMTCPACNGATKLPAETHDSPYIQFIPCARCDGTGKILMI
ncbi:MAG: hypothetical protein Q7R91_02190 [bacterium]|nr:hypothetical protein [bacterium]